MNTARQEVRFVLVKSVTCRNALMLHGRVQSMLGIGVGMKIKNKGKKIMPNHIKNRLIINGSKEQIEEVKNFLKAKDEE